MTGSIQNKTVKSIIWSAVERLSVQGVTFVVGIILARIVSPEDYGLIAMLSIFLVTAQLFTDSGFSNALIQKQACTEIDYSTVFYFNIVISLCVYALLFAVAPYIALFYKEPLLTPVTRYIGLNIIISAFSVVQRAKLTIQLDFRTQAKASLISVVIGGTVGIVCACRGYGVWALVMQALLSTVFNNLLLWYFSPWRPRLLFSWHSFRTLFSFGSKLLLSGLLHNIYINMYSLVIGRKYNVTDVGYYNRAYSLAQFPSINLSQIIVRATFPIQCQLQDDDERLNQSFVQYLRFSAFIIFPLMTGLLVLAKPFVLLILTEKWLPIAGILQILCLAYMWYPVMLVNNNILNVKGRSDYFLKAELIKKICAVLILLATMSHGLYLLCWGMLFYNAIDMVVIIYYAKKVIQTGYRSQIKNLFPILLLSVGMGITVMAVISLFENLYLQVVIGVVTGIVSYYFYSRLFRFNEITEITQVLHRLLQKKNLPDV